MNHSSDSAGTRVKEETSSPTKTVMESSQETHAAESQASPSKQPLSTRSRRPADMSLQAPTASPKRRRCRPHQPPWKYWENKQLELDVMRARLDSMERTAYWRAECLERVIARGRSRAPPRDLPFRTGWLQLQTRRIAQFRRTVAHYSVQLERFEDVLETGEQLTEEYWALLEERYWRTY